MSYIDLLGRTISSPPRCPVCTENYVSGNYSVHRDGYGEGPEVDICDSCGSGIEPTLDHIWSELHDMLMPGGTFEAIAVHGRDGLTFSLHRHPQDVLLSRMHAMACGDAEITVLDIFEAGVWGTAKSHFADLMAEFTDQYFQERQQYPC